MAAVDAEELLDWKEIENPCGDNLELATADSVFMVSP